MCLLLTADISLLSDEIEAAGGTDGALPSPSASSSSIRSFSFTENLSSEFGINDAS